MFQLTSRSRPLRWLVSGLMVGLAVGSVGSIASASTLGLAPALAQTGPPAAESAPTIVGAWKTAVQRADGTIASGLLLFASDGTITRISNTSTQGPNVGVWSQMSDDTFAFTYWAFTFGAGGNWTGSVKTNAQLTVSTDGKGYDGTFTNYTLDTNDNVTQTVPGSVHASRLQIDLTT
jgi:hypothetical protein